MTNKILLACSFLIASFSSFSQDKYQRNESVDIKHYRFQIEISDDSDEIKGETEVKAAVLKSIDQLQLDLVAMTDAGKGMKVDGVKLNGKSIRFEQVGEKLNLQGSAEAGEAIWQITYHGIPADGLIISKNKHGNRTFFCDNWPNRAHHYVPVIDHPYEKATSEFIIIAPSKYQVVSNGLWSESVDLKNGMRRTRWTSTQELPTKVMVFGAAEFAVQRSGESMDIPVYAWVYPEEEEKGFYDYGMTVQILDWFQGKIGDYPYDQLSNVQSKTRYGGMENAGCIFYHEHSIDGKQGSESLFAHEIAHQWFGNSASEADWHHVWLSEGFATYLTEVYKQEVHGEEAFQKGMEAARQKVLAFTNKYPEAQTIDTNISNLNQLLSPMTYQRAAWILHMLRGVVGEEAFWQGVKNYYERYEFNNAFSNDLKDELEKASGKDLDEFFNRWLYQPGMVQMKEPTWRFDPRNRTVHITIEQGKQWFPCPVQVRIVFDEGENQLSNIYYMTDKSIQIKEASLRKPVRIEVDPINWILKE